MTDTTPESVVETAVPDENATEVAKADSSPAVTDTSDKSPPETDDEKLSEKVQKRIGKLTGKWRQAESNAEYWRSRALQSERSAPPAQEPAQQPKAKKLADFNYDEDAYEAHLREQVRAESQQRLEKDRTESARKARETSFREREEKFREEVEDYEEVAYSAPISDQVADLIKSMDDGPELGYYLGKNPSVAKRISAMSETLAAAQLVLLSDRLATEREQAKAKPVSKAPPPPPRIEANDAAVEKTPDDMSVREWLKWRNKQLAKK